MTITNPSDTPAISTVAVVGAGFLGRQIAVMTAASGCDVRITDTVPEAAFTTHDWLRTYLAAPIADGTLDWDLEDVLSRIVPVPTQAEALNGADLMIEAVREDLDTKREVFAEASRLNPAAYLATNSSSIASSQLADVVSQTDRLVNLHFFPEFWSRAMVELMGCGETSDETLITLAEFGRSLGLFCAVVDGQSKGFIINRVWRAVKKEALKVVDEGHASPEDVDRLWAFFWGINYGPFAMMDQIGLDVVADIEDTYIAVATDTMDRRSSSLHARVEGGKLGVKSGQGFYHYPNPAYEAPDWPRVSEFNDKL